ncbi:hypothetical protein RIF29_17558 [Crotalaria pallida]|uniref:Peptide N-acetyl-beta-D-glucosaminyl asparaginase amidase A N-terminal domain-containing protein n=1 Tax=Crotalaria pallida TaxID=3830 RepID=A0AAN9FHI9_CROPI
MNTLNCFLFLLLPFFFFFFFTHPASSSTPYSHQNHLTLSPSLRNPHPQQYFEVTYPPPSHSLTPSCSHQILHHSFANTINSPPHSTPYSPPSHCPLSPRSRILLHFHAHSKGEQYDRIAALWLAGVELLRTSTAEPTASGVFWNVRKDVTRYSSLLLRSDLNLTMMLENIINSEFTGVYHVNVTLLFYTDNAVRVPFRRSFSRSLIDESESESGFDDSEPPADLIVPISSDGKRGFWFMVESEKDLHSRTIRIPKNANRAVLELCVSFHGNDEFWYSNPPNLYIMANGLATGRGNGAYREVYVTIDGEIVEWEVPFPVIFTGGINPLFWEPVVAIGAFDLPSYDIDLTPFLGKVLDGKEHSFGIGVVNGISYWLVNANLHLWLDHDSSVVHANPFVHQSPKTSIKHQEKFTGLDGKFEVQVDKEIQIAGWVASSAGNITTTISQGFTLKNSIKFESNGTYKLVKQKFKAKKEVKVINERGELISELKVKRQYPLRIITLTRHNEKDTDDRHTLVTNVKHAMKEKYIGGRFSHSVSNVQDSNGWMEVEDHSVLSGEATTEQNYIYIDSFNCYSRNVAAANSKIIGDNSSFQCKNS